MKNKKNNPGRLNDCVILFTNLQILPGDEPKII